MICVKECVNVLKILTLWSYILMEPSGLAEERNVGILTSSYLERIIDKHILLTDGCPRVARNQGQAI